MNRFQKFNYNRNRSLSVGKFKPESWDEVYIHNLALALGETEVRYLLSVLERYGVTVIKATYAEFRQVMREKRHIRSRKKFFTFLLEERLRKLNIKD